jgi:hypothetical protein
VVIMRLGGRLVQIGLDLNHLRVFIIETLNGMVMNDGHIVLGLSDFFVNVDSKGIKRIFVFIVYGVKRK